MVAGPCDVSGAPRRAAPYLFTGAALALLACGGGSGGGPDASGTDASSRPDAYIDTGETPRIEPASCRFNVDATLGAEGVDYECGDLIVLEDRELPDGRRLRLHFVRLRGAPGPVATIYLDGGPGGNGNNILAYLAYLGPEFVDDLLALGDFLVIAQRGTTLSHPSLRCQEWEPTGCAERLLEEADLADFNTGANADDVDDLRAALGYDQLNLYGISYGSRLTLEVLRRHGAGVRAAVAGGTVPAQVLWPAEIPASFHGALTGLAEACATDVDCAGAYGNVYSAFTNAVVALDQEPALFDYHGELVSIDGQSLASITFRLMYSRSSYAMLPLLITDLGQRRTDRVAGWLTSIFDSYGSSSLSDGLYYSVVCGELFNPADEAAFDAANQHVPAVVRQVMSNSWYSLLYTCSGWPKGGSRPDLAAPVVSDVPTFVPNGSFDPITPPRFGDIAMTTLERGTATVFANSGHGATLQTACGNRTLLAFLAAPEEPLDQSCAAEIELPFVLPTQAATFALAPQALRVELDMVPVPPELRRPVERALRDRRRAPAP